MAGLRFTVKYPVDNTVLYCGSRPFRQGSSTGQATVVRKMILVSARDKMKRSGRCRDMHDVQCGDSPGYLGDKDPENGQVRVSAKKQNNGLWKRMPCTKSRLHHQLSRQKIHSKEVKSVRKGSTACSHVQISCARSTHEDEGYLQTVTSNSTDLVVRSDTTDETPDADSGFSSDMMAKPQSVVKLRRFGALFCSHVLW